MTDEGDAYELTEVELLNELSAVSSIVTCVNISADSDERGPAAHLKRKTAVH